MKYHLWFWIFPYLFILAPAKYFFKKSFTVTFKVKEENKFSVLFQLSDYCRSFVYVYTMEMYISSPVMRQHNFLLSNIELGTFFFQVLLSSAALSFQFIYSHRGPDKRWDLVNTTDPLCSPRLPLWYCDHKQCTIGGILVLIVHNY